MTQNAPISDFDMVKGVVESELGQPISEFFSEFAEKPLASASLGQVHKAKLRATGETVVVKVQHGRLREQVPGDLNIVQIAVDIGCWLFPEFKYKWLAVAFKRDLPPELDYHKEARNAERCSEMFKSWSNVSVPKVYSEFTRERILVMSYEEGTPVTHVKKMQEQGINLRELSNLISEAFNHMIFREGFVHGDPHPGNLFARKKADGELELVLLDHGIYTALSTECRLGYTKLWRGILTQDELLLKEASKELGAEGHELFTAMVTSRKFEDVMDKSKKQKLKARLGDRTDEEAKADMKKFAAANHKNIVSTLGDINH